MAGKTHRIGPSLIDTVKQFGSEEACHNYLAAARWPGGIKCLKCDHDKVVKFTVNGKPRVDKKTGEQKRGPDRYMYRCLKPECRYQFQSTTGTLFSDTHLPLSKWMLATAIMCNAKKSVSAKQMERDMGVSYKTAWYLNQRIRKAMDEGFTGMLDGVVEIDTTQIGGKFDKRRKRARWHGRQTVAGMVKRGENGEPSQVRVMPVEKEIKPVMSGVIIDNISLDATIYSDEHGSYRYLGKEGRKHEIVRHTSNQYVRSGGIHTNSVEGAWSLFKRAVIGSFHQVSIKHLDRYLGEFQFKFNERRNEAIFARVIIGLVSKGALRYKVLTGPTDAELEALQAQPESEMPSDPSQPF